MKKSAKKNKKKTKSFSKIPIIRLGPSPAGPTPLAARVGRAGITINADGKLVESPTKIDVFTGDFVSWLVVNESDKTAKIRTKKFLKHGRESSPIRFLDKDKVTVEKNGGTGTLTGVVVYLPPGESDEFKYTIEVRGKKDADYDPDLIIRRPPV